MESLKISKEDLEELKVYLANAVKDVIDSDCQARYLSKKSTCDYFKVSNNTLDKWIKMGMPVIRINGVVRFDRYEIDKWVAEKYNESCSI